MGEIGQVGHEVGVDHRPVLVADGSVCNDVGKAWNIGREQREVRGEEEETDALLRIPPLYFGQDGERRIVHHHAAFRIIRRTIVSARPEGTYYLPASDVCILPEPSQYGIVDVGWRITVVGGFLGLELLHESLIVFSFLNGFVCFFLCHIVFFLVFVWMYGFLLYFCPRSILT